MKLGCKYASIIGSIVKFSWNNSGPSEIFINEQNTSNTFTRVPDDTGAKMGTHGRWLDNPFSEIHIRMLKHRPDYPKRFHSGISFLHSADLHVGRHGQVNEKRQATLDAASAKNLESFNRKSTVSWIPEDLDQQIPHELN